MDLHDKERARLFEMAVNRASTAVKLTLSMNRTHCQPGIQALLECYVGLLGGYHLAVAAKLNPDNPDDMERLGALAKDHSAWLTDFVAEAKAFCDQKMEEHFGAGG